MTSKTVFRHFLAAAGISLLSSVTIYAAENHPLAFAQCEDYVNIRSEANTDSEVVAKLYNNGSAEIIDQVDDWYEIQSGNVIGYIKAEYLATGEEAEKIANRVAYNVAVVYPEYLNVRSTPDADSEPICVAHENDELEVVAYENDWMKVAFPNDVYGYVSADYVGYKTYYPTAKTAEEELEEAQMSEQRDAYEEAIYDSDSAEAYTETVNEEITYDDDSTEAYTETVNEEITYDDDSTEAYAETTYEEIAYDSGSTETYTDTAYGETTYDSSTAENYAETTYDSASTENYAETTASSSGTGQQIADYAVQFVGNPYVWGGTSLTNGADCSGFTMAVFANFGIGLAHNAAAQVGGSNVSLDNLQPGDLLFYSDGGEISHVAIYIGGGQIVHAANSNSGIIISSYNYNTPVCASRYW